jgi:hypothetical protein
VLSAVRNLKAVSACTALVNPQYYLCLCSTHTRPQLISHIQQLAALTDELDVCTVQSLLPPELVHLSCTQPQVGLLHLIQMDAAKWHITRGPAGETAQQTAARAYEPLQQQLF